MEQITISKFEKDNPDDKYRGLGLTGYDAEQIIAAANEALEEVRVSLMMSYRFMDAALWHMPFTTMPYAANIGTNGSTLSFNPLRVAQQYCNDSNELARDYLHAIMHCVYRHPFDENHNNPWAWTLACDIVAELSALEMAHDKFPSTLDKERMMYARKLESMRGTITPYKLYRLFDSIQIGFDANEETGMSRSLMAELKEVFERDNHLEYSGRFV